MRYEKIREAAARMKRNMKSNVVEPRTVDHILFVRECIRKGPESTLFFDAKKLPPSLLRHPVFRDAYLMAEQATADFQLYTVADD